MSTSRSGRGRYDRAVRLTERIHLIGSGEADLVTTDPIDSQVYLIEADGGHVVVDGGAGRSVDAILANVVGDGLDPADIGWLLITHAHGDHAGAGPAWRARVPGLRIAASNEVAGWLETADEEATSVDRARRAGIYPADYRLTPCEVDLRMADGALLELGDGLRLTTVATPGHAAGHLSFLLEDGTGTGQRRATFSGDALFPGGLILLQDTWDCDVNAALRSVERLAALDADHLLAGHLGPVIGDARAHAAIGLGRIAALLPPANLL
jgi:glyoxylase-like metal-dependent hydrolase (beta-lactamase superfamily II)